MQKARRHHTKWLRPLVGAWFQGLFHSSVRGAFHLSLTVLVRYRSLGSIQPCGMVPADSDGIPRVPPYSGAAPVLSACRVPASHRLRGRVPSPSATLPGFLWSVLQPRHAPKRRRFGLVPVRSPLLGESLLLSFPAGTKMFQFPAFASAHRADVGIAPDGLPHSDICGSRCICHSPQLFAACHVLLRLREPRHPPCALLVPLCLHSALRLKCVGTKFDISFFAFRFARETFVVFLLLSSSLQPYGCQLPALSLCSVL